MLLAAAADDVADILCCWPLLLATAAAATDVIALAIACPVLPLTVQHPSLCYCLLCYSSRLT